MIMEVVTMGQFIFTFVDIEGLCIIEPKVFGDSRGYFFECYNYEDFKKAGIDRVFVQDNQSKSSIGVLRGLHFQKKHQQGKLVRVTKGEVFDVAVDIRKDSVTFGKWFGVVLSEKNKKEFYIPEGFAHGFLVLSEEAEFTYKCTDFYHPEFESGIAYNDGKLAIKWPTEGIEHILLSDKDKNWKALSETNLID